MTWGIPATTIHLYQIVGALASLLVLTWSALASPALPQWVLSPRWAQGWLVPHAEPREKCRGFDGEPCATCRGKR